MTDLHQKLMDTAYDRYKSEGISRAEFLDSLSAQERFAVHTGNFCYQVQNGGFMQWWDNQYGTAEVVEYLLRAMARVGTETTKKVEDLLLVYKKSMELRKRDRRDRDCYDADGDWEEMSKELDGLETAFYAIDDQFLKDCEAHLQKGGW